MSHRGFRGGRECQAEGREPGPRGGRIPVSLCGEERRSGTPLGGRSQGPRDPWGDGYCQFLLLEICMGTYIFTIVISSFWMDPVVIM